MSSLGICLICCALTQWNAPIIEEAELAPPSAAPASPRTESWDMDNRRAAKEGAPVSEEVKTRWEYDEEGRLVVRQDQENKDAAPSKPKETVEHLPLTEKPVTTPQKSKETVAAKNQSDSQAKQKRTSGTGRIATFWFVLPKR